MSKKISAHFSLEEFTFSQTAAREGIDNRPNKDQISSMMDLCRIVLEPLREAVGSPIVVTSGFRSARLNRAVGGAENSQHMDGKAADLVSPNFVTKAFFARVIEVGVPFDQLIFEGGKQSSWVHISYDGAGCRQQILRATFPEGGGVIYRRLSKSEALDTKALTALP